MKRILFLFCICIIYPTFADVYTSDIYGACGGPDNFYANFSANKYTCNFGYFLPANSLVCATCPSGFSCAGGIYTFNETKNSGLVKDRSITENINNACATNFAHQLKAGFVRNQYTCNSGYYMPANYDGCTICPADSYCGGGTYTFNENVPQGIVSCGAGLFAPNGMWEAAQCGRILHVGDGFVYLRATKKTSPALHLDLDHDGVADYFGNMTTMDVPMSRGTQRKLKVRYNNTTYSVYDDSVDLSLYE